MNLLALDTSTPVAALALHRTDGASFLAVTDPATRLGRSLLPTIHNLLKDAEMRPGDLEYLAVGLGPGSYTGLRVGVTAAKVLAYALNRPVIGLDSLDIVARGAPTGPLRLVVASDAQRGDLHVAEFLRESPQAPPVRLGPTRIEAATDLVARLDPSTTLIGPGASKIRAADPAIDLPSPRPLLELALEAARAGQFAEVWTLEPVYLRRSAAEDQWEARR